MKNLNSIELKLEKLTVIVLLWYGIPKNLQWFNWRTESCSG